MDGNVAKINPEKCVNCGKCEEVCPTKAINRY
jgi:formate hydrogenlyase subunit 6/NADH:ubiquinone oxidoreductase subunit I